MWGEYQPEKAERKYLEHAARRALGRAGLTEDDVDYFVAGDLMNQIVSSTFSARSLGIPHIGVFAACATSTLGLGLAAMLVDGGFARRVLVATASHYQSVERQYRYPIELNVQHKPTNQWTATGGAAAVVAAEGDGPRISQATFGRVMDWGVKDVNHMGAAMAPAATDTLLRHFQDTNTTPADYDLILTGDLAQYGSKLFRELADRVGVTLGAKHMDAGASMYSPEQPSGAGGERRRVLSRRRVRLRPEGNGARPLQQGLGFGHRVSAQCADVAARRLLSRGVPRRRHRERLMGRTKMIYFWAFVVGGLIPR